MDKAYIDRNLLLPGSRKEYAFAVCFFDGSFPKTDKERNKWKFAYDYIHHIDHSLFRDMIFMEKLQPYIDKIRNCKYEYCDGFIDFICGILHETDLLGFIYGKYGYHRNSVILSDPCFHEEVYAHSGKELIISGLNTDELYDFYKRSIDDPVFNTPVEEFFYYTLIWTYTHNFDDQVFSIDYQKLYEVETSVGFSGDDYPYLTYDFDFEYAREEYRNGNKDIFKKFRPMTIDEKRKFGYTEEED